MTPSPSGSAVCLVPRPVDVGGGFLAREIEGERIIQAGSSVHQLQGLFIIALEMFELPAAHVRTLVAEGNPEEIGVDHQGRQRLRRGHGRGGLGGCHQGDSLLARGLGGGSGGRSGGGRRRFGRHGGLRHRGGRRGSQVFEEIGGDEHHRTHEQEGEQQAHFHRHFFGRVTAVSAVYRFGHSKIPCQRWVTGRGRNRRVGTDGSAPAGAAPSRHHEPRHIVQQPGAYNPNKWDKSGTRQGAAGTPTSCRCPKRAL